MAAMASAVGADVLAATSEHLARHVLDRWPAGSLIAAPIARVIEQSLHQIHRSIGALVGRPLAVDRWLSTALGGAPAGMAPAAVGQWSADRLIGLMAGTATAPPHLAVAGLPGWAPGSPGPWPSLPGYTPPGRWDERAVLRALLSLGRIGALEAATLPARLAIAAAMAGTAVALPGVRSTATVGSRVHGVLQQRYRNAYAPPNLVVTDRRVWGGMPPSYTGQALSSAAVGGPPALGAMYLAWLSSSFASSRRADVTDLGRAANWEIKPLLQAPIGVMQEAWYRCAYNWTAENLAATNPALAGRFPWLLPGPTWEPSLLRTIPIPPQGGQPAAAIPFSTMALPGMVLYAVVSGPTMVDLAILVTLMLRLIEREVQRRLQEAVAAARAVLDALAAALEEVAAWVSEHLVALVVIVALAGLAAALIMTAPAWGPALGVAGAGLAALAAATAGGALILGPLGDPSSTEQPVGLDFGPVSVRMPPSYVPRFTTGINVVMAEGLGALSRAAGPPSIA